MVNYKVCTENNNFSPDASAKIEVETNGKGDTVCHCNVKENTELVAEILDYDANGEEAPTVDAVPVSELLNLRDELYEKDQITMCGLEKLNQLIAVYSNQLKEREHPIESTPLNQEGRWLKTV